MANVCLMLAVETIWFSLTKRELFLSLTLNKFNVKSFLMRNIYFSFLHQGFIIPFYKSIGVTFQTLRGNLVVLEIPKNLTHQF